MIAFDDIVYQFKQLLELAETEDLPEDALKDTMESLTLDFEEQAEQAAIIIKELEADTEKLKAVIAKLEDKAERLERNKNRLKTGLEMAMRAIGKTKFKTLLFSFNIQKNGGKTPVIVDVDVNKLPDTLVKVKKEPDLTAIRQYLQENPDSGIAHFGERGESLRIR